MKFINKLERKFGRYSISNLTIYIIGCYVIGYILSYVNIGGVPLTYYLSLEPYLIFRGQVWRLITWVLIPPGDLDIFTIFMLSLYYFMGNMLESTWGSFRYNLYIFSGMFFTVLGAILMEAVCLLFFGEVFVAGFMFSTYYINMSIYLACAVTHPNMELLIYFVIPVKLKWLALLNAAMLVYYMITGDPATRVAIIASLLNFIIFYFGSRNYKRISPSEVKRRRGYSKQVKQASSITRHKCAICGRTEQDGDDLEFRFCSKCDGNYEYCQDHLFTHKHVKK